MANDREIVRRGVDFQNRARDYPLMQLPGYTEWSEATLDAGGSAALIGHLDAISMRLLPEEVAGVGADETRSFWPNWKRISVKW